MPNKLIVILASCSLIAAILACNAPTAQNNNQPDYASTITAQAVLIAQTGNQSTDTPMPAQAATPTPSAVTADVTAATNCRTGPGTAYSVVASLTVGQNLTVVGQDTPDSYWIVNNPSGIGTCWLWGQSATVIGDPTGLPQISPSVAPTPKATKTPRPTATSTKDLGSAPAAPTNVTVGQQSCKLVKTNLGTYNYEATFIISWFPTSDPSVQGYHIYRDNSLISTFEVGQISYTDKVTITAINPATFTGVKETYEVQAYNKAGGSSRVGGTAQCP